MSWLIMSAAAAFIFLAAYLLCRDPDPATRDLAAQLTATVTCQVCTTITPWYLAWQVEDEMDGDSWVSCGGCRPSVADDLFRAVPLSRGVER